MSVDQLIAELNALPVAERRQVAYAILSEQTSQSTDRMVAKENAASGVVHETHFSQRWSGKFNLPESDQNDARLSYLLHRYSA